MTNLPTIIFNDENRTLLFKIMDEQGVAPINLTGMTLKFSLGDSSTTPQFTGTMVITSATLGECQIVISPAQINALTSGRLRYNIRETAPVNRVLSTGFVNVQVTFT